MAALFRLRGKASMPESEFVLAASMGTRWFGPKDAQRLLQMARDAGLLELQGRDIAPTFDLDAVDVPLDFRPSEGLLKQKPPAKALREELVEALAARGVPPDRYEARAAAVQASMDVTSDTALLLAAAEHGVDVGPWIERVRSALRPSGS